MFSSQPESTEDVRVNDKIAHVGVNQHCTLTHMLKASFLYFPSPWVEKYLHQDEGTFKRAVFTN